MNTTTRFFQDKTQYTAFRKAFANAQQDKRAHKSYTEGTTDIWDSKAQAKKTIKVRYKHDGWMCSTHYLLFNLVCDRNYYNGFTPKTSKAFVENAGDADRGLNGAIEHLLSLIGDANLLLGNNVAPQAPSWIKDKKQWVGEQMQAAQNRINAFLEPLGGVFTLADLARVQLPSFPGLTTEQVKEYAGKPITYKELFGEQVTDQTPDEDDDVSPNGSTVQTATRLASEESASTSATADAAASKKKGFLTRLFGG